jgi:hypothetical protein
VRVKREYWKAIGKRLNGIVIVSNWQNGKQEGKLVKINARRQVTLPAHVRRMYLKQWEWALATVWRLRKVAMGVGPGDHLQILEGPDGFILRPSRIDHSRLAPLRHLIPPDAPPFDIRKFRDGTYDPALRD